MVSRSNSEKITLRNWRSPAANIWRGSTRQGRSLDPALVTLTNGVAPWAGGQPSGTVNEKCLQIRAKDEGCGQDSWSKNNLQNILCERAHNCCQCTISACWHGQYCPACRTYTETLCQACASNRYGEQGRISQCTLTCLAGNTVTSSCAGFDACAAGKYLLSASASCISCPTNMWSMRGTSHCYCVVGYTVVSSTCLPCQRGQFSSDNSACKW